MDHQHDRLRLSLLSTCLCIGSLTLLLLVCFQTQAVLAEGFRNPYQDAAAIAQGNAFVAQADNASALFYNPAGMTQLHGTHINVGVQLMSINTNFTSPVGATTTNTSPAVGLPPPGQIFLTANLKDLGVSALGDLSVGLGVLNLYGFAAKYPINGPVATSMTFAQLPLIAIKPTIAYKVTESLSVGLGADILTFSGLLGEGQAERQFRAPPGLGFPTGTELELNGKGTTAGLNVSFLYAPWRNEAGKPRLTLAGIWRSQAVLPLNGVLLANGNLVSQASTSLRLPEIWTGGIAYWPVRNREREWKIEVDVDYVRWQAIRDASVHLSNGGVFPGPQQWRNALTVNVGTEFKWLGLTDTRGWDVAVRTGYSRSHHAAKDLSFDPAFPESDIHVTSVGLGFVCHSNGKLLGLFACGSDAGRFLATSSIGLDIFYQGIVFDTRTVAGNLNPTVDGTYETLVHTGGATFRLSW